MEKQNPSILLPDRIKQHGRWKWIEERRKLFLKKNRSIILVRKEKGCVCIYLYIYKVSLLPKLPAKPSRIFRKYYFCFLIFQRLYHLFLHLFLSSFFFVFFHFEGSYPARHSKREDRGRGLISWRIKWSLTRRRAANALTCYPFAMGVWGERWEPNSLSLSLSICCRQD